MALGASTFPNSTYSVGFKPKQNIPESEKNETWCKENVNWCISMSPVWFKHETDEYYNRYNGFYDDSMYKHLTEMFGIASPADKIKNIPLMRPLISRLHSDQEEREINFSVYSEDTDSVMEKIQDISGKLLSQVMDVIKHGDIDKDLDKLEAYYKHEFKSEFESGAYHFLMQYILNHRMDRKFSDNFLDKIITGNEYYSVKVNRLGEDPIYDGDIKPGGLFFADNIKKWICECDWAVRPVEMSPTELLDQFGERMKEEDRKTLESWTDMYHKDAFYKLTSAAQADMMQDANTSQRLNVSVNHKIAVYYVEWKSIRKVAYVENENKYIPDAPFIKIIDDDQLRIPFGQSGYVSKKKLKYRYVQDLWAGIRIGDNMFADLGRVKYPVRNMAEPSKVNLSYNGLTYNGKIKPFSLIKETKDLEDLYRILHFHKENLIALSGVKGSYMDLSQLPDFGTGKFDDNMKMFLYYKKMGTAFIQRKESSDKSFNQFPSYDDTLGAGLTAILGMIQQIEVTAHRICGVPRQAMGDVSNGDGKFTTQTALGQGSMVNEYLFNEHDEFVQRALTDIANAGSIAYKDGKNGYYMSDQRTQEIFTFNPGGAMANLGVHITNKGSDRRNVAELKQMTMSIAAQGLLNYEDVLPLFKKGSLSEILRLIEANMAKRRIEMSEQQQQMQQMQSQLLVAKEQAEIGKLQGQIAEISAAIEENRRRLDIEEREVNDRANEGIEKVKLDQQRVNLEAKQLDLAAQGKNSKSAEVKNK